MSRPMVFVDLDDTLFQTLRKCPPDEPHEHLTLAAQATNGAHSMMTRRQKALVDWLIASAETIPVTARSTEAYSRVAIGFQSFAILANGAVILGPDGAADAEWAEVMARDLGGFEETLEALLEHGRAAAEAGAAVHGPVGQGDFLDSLGLHQRAAILKRHRPDTAGTVDAAVARLTGRDQMGTLFKVLGICGWGWPFAVGFD